jgi:hypothetical protein
LKEGDTKVQGREEEEKGKKVLTLPFFTGSTIPSNDATANFKRGQDVSDNGHITWGIGNLLLSNRTNHPGRSRS